MTRIFFLLPLFAMQLILGCQDKNGAPDRSDHSPSLDTVALRKTIDEKNKQFGKAHVLRDTSFLNNIFTAEARIFAPNAEIVQGRKAIAEINWAYVNFGIHEFLIETTSLYGSGNYLVNEGTYSMTYGKDSTTEKGKFVFVWKLIDGDWKLDADIWNSSMPVAPAK